MTKGISYYQYNHAHTTLLFILLLTSTTITQGRDLSPYETIRRANPQLKLGPEFLYVSKDGSSNQDGEEEEDYDVHPIIEYVNASSTNDASERPDFLFDNVDYHRMVVFYSPSCPHCIHFAPKYKKFANYFQSIQDANTNMMQHKVKFFALSCQSYKNICRSQKVSAYPTVRLFLAHDTHELQLTGGGYDEVLHPYTILKVLGEGFVIDNKRIEQQQRQSVELEQAESAVVSYSFGKRNQAEMYGDAYLAFYQSMTENVFTEKIQTLFNDKENSNTNANPLRVIKKQPLLSFLKLLANTLPPWRIHFLLQELIDDFRGHVKSEADWMAVLNRYPPVQWTYSTGCQQHESPYTCGLWTLFHIMTVGLVEQNRAVVPTEDNSFPYESPIKAAQTLRDYIYHFMTCKECADHFVETFDSCAYDRCKRLVEAKGTNNNLLHWIELPLWLVEFHNGMNLRLQKKRQGRDVMSTAETQTVMWPPVTDCPHCWIKPGAAHKVDSAKMYDYLKRIYWPENSFSIPQQQQPWQRHNFDVSANSALTKAVELKQPMNSARILLQQEGTKSEGPFLLVTAAVAVVWIAVFWKRYHMERLLGIHRTKEA